MDLEKEKRRQSLRVIISETFMVIAVVVTVLVLAFIVSGYWLGKDFKVERQGLLQISSIPTGAYVSIDNSEPSWFQRTNTSKMLSAGKHNVVLTKEDYDTWSKTVDIVEGLLYRVHYPRLFLLEREKESLLKTDAGIATASPDHKSLLLIDETTLWTFIDLDSETLEPKMIDVSSLFSSVSLASGASVGLFTGEILSMTWNHDGDKILFATSDGVSQEWSILDLKTPKNSVNLTKDFDLDFSSVQILDNAANNLLVIAAGNLRKIDVPGHSISAVLAENVISFDHYDSEVIFSAKTLTGDFYIGNLKLSDQKIKKLDTLDSSAKVLLSRFYDDKYLTVIEGSEVSVLKRDDNSEVFKATLTFVPKSAKVGHNGEFITLSLDNHIATLDMESMELIEWDADGDHFDFLDNDMIYSVADGKLIVYDFDGYNRRVLAENVSERFPVMITNDRYLYYFSDGMLTREWLVTR